MEQLRPPGSPATRPAGSPVPVTSPLHPMHVDNLISPRGYVVMEYGVGGGGRGVYTHDRVCWSYYIMS